MSASISRPDWPEIQRQFQEYVAAYRMGNAEPACRDSLFSSIYQAVEYLSATRYRRYAGYGTNQTDFAVDAVKNAFWKIEKDDGRNARHKESTCEVAEIPHNNSAGNRRPRTFTSLVTEEYKGEVPIEHFLSVVVGNALRDWFRAQNRIRNLNLTLSDDLLRELFEVGIAEIPATSAHLAWGIGTSPAVPDEQIQSNELHRILNTLDEQDRRILELYYFQGMSSQEISRHLNINCSTVRTRISRAVQAIRALL